MYCVRPYDPKIEKSIGSKKPLLARLLSQRKIEDVDHFLNPPNDAYLRLKNVSLVKNIKDVSSLLMKMSRSKKSIACIGDYDTDGIVSSYMIQRLCEIMNIECHVFLPSRFEQGYGLNEKTMASFLAFTVSKQTPDALFILDCGSSSEKEITKLKSFGISDVVVIDHHIIKEDCFSKSANVVVNWRIGDNSQEMCSCGLVYLIALDILSTYGSLNQDNIKELLSLAAMEQLLMFLLLLEITELSLNKGCSFLIPYHLMV